jgi:hypothetical protein
MSDVFLTLNKITLNKGNEEDRGYSKGKKCIYLLPDM